MQQLSTLDASTLSPEALVTGRNQAVAQMQWMRQYTLTLIETVPIDLWYVLAPGATTHFAWQVGHLAVAQYGLMLFRQRGRAESDIELMPGWLRKNFGKGSAPSTNAADPKNPSPQTLLEHLHAIHEQGCQTAAQLSHSTLMETIDMPYAAYPNKLGALVFCPLHESIHAGQIGLLRRLHGLAPVR